MDASSTQYHLLQNFGYALRSFPQVDFSTALSQGQISSKQWLIQELEKLNVSLGTVFLLGGWWAVLSNMMFTSRLRFDKIRSFDIDPTCAAIADKMNYLYLIDNWKFKASTADMMQINYLKTTYFTEKSDGSKVELVDIPNTLINTSCEHLKDFSLWFKKIPNQKLLVLQSNNNFHVADHVGAVNSLEEFRKIAPLAEVYFSGTLPLEGYDRFMLIGRK